MYGTVNMATIALKLTFLSLLPPQECLLLEGILQKRELTKRHSKLVIFQKREECLTQAKRHSSVQQGYNLRCPQYPSFRPFWQGNLNSGKEEIWG